MFHLKAKFPLGYCLVQSIAILGDEGNDQLFHQYKVVNKRCFHSPFVIPKLLGVYLLYLDQGHQFVQL